ncbi:heavy metal-binding domain-containing protein [uncultured Methanofollis sp.]|uniref:heavy metal-binding domain-containing protein n=1 Tax=uncultured Methanofollis sp. TaxID=262500 RepID=UPI00260EEA69|nr:heavy metal-binding domain-containing protein [uncultured Methanofollis sp.]
MIITTTESIPGHEFEVLGLVVGSTVQAKNIGRDILSGLKGMVGGEITAYTEMLSEARDIALNRMEKEAEKLGANAVIGLRFSTAEAMPGAAELMAYGTAVRLR